VAGAAGRPPWHGRQVIVPDLAPRTLRLGARQRTAAWPSPGKEECESDSLRDAVREVGGGRAADVRCGRWRLIDWLTAHTGMPLAVEGRAGRP
jgi:hypothetical protein